MVVEWVAEEVPPYRWTNGRKVEMGGGAEASAGIHSLVS